MSYGLKCFSASGYITFDTTLMSSYLKITASGTVSLNAGALSSTITANEVDYIYVWNGTTVSPANTVADRYQIESRLTNSFRIRNTSSQYQTFNYIAFTR